MAELNGMKRSPPRTSRLPVNARKAQCNRMADVLEVCWSVMGDQGMDAGAFVAYMRAASAISSASTPVIDATRSRGYSRTRSTKASEAARPPRHEFLVVKPLVEDHVEPSEAHRGVRAGPERQPEIGDLRVLALARVEDDQLRPVRLGHADGLELGRPAMAPRVVSEKHDALRVQHVPTGDTSRRPSG